MIQYITHADVLRHTIATRWPSLFIKKQKKPLQAHECCKNRITLPYYIKKMFKFLSKYYLHSLKEVLVFLCPFLPVFLFFAVA